jgi:hypothetical protein
MIDNQKILDDIFNFFVRSMDFNGIPLMSLIRMTDNPSLIEIIKEEIINENISIQSSINPHIISLGHFDIETQIRILNDSQNNICLYPTQKYLQLNRDVSEYNDSPFTQKLALGEPQLKPYFFDIEVLDRYFRDPRYSFEFRDYSGQISYTEDENNIPTVSESDQVFLQTFGLGVNEKKERVAVVYLRYLKDLTPEHQIYWRSRKAKGDCIMLKEYYVNTIEGDYTNSYSIFSGFLGEQRALNDLSKGIFDVALFNKTYEKENRPKEFTFFFIPTLKNYHDFVLLLDKMISDNLNKDFFKSQKVELFEKTEHEDGTFERKDKGTLRLLNEWLNSVYNVPGKGNLNDLLKIFKKIRKERQDPAHKIDENIFDKSLIEKQKELIKEAYLTIKTLRRIFQRHPKAENIKIEKWLDVGEIKIF